MKTLREELEELASKYDERAKYWRNCETSAREHVVECTTTASEHEQRAKEIRELIGNAPA